MKQPQSKQNGEADVQLDRLLAQLRQAEPSAGLHDRLLQRLQGHAQSQTENQAAVVPANTRVRPMFPIRAKLLWPFGLTAVAAVVCALTLLPRPRPSHTQPPAPATFVSESSPATPKVPDAASPSSPVRFFHSQLASSTLTRHRNPPVPAATRPAASSLSPEEAKALDDLHAPSQPAPPLPLTAQEKAILHLLRRDGTVELAQLDLALQTRLSELQRANFQQFFDPPPSPRPEGETNDKTYAQ